MGLLNAIEQSVTPTAQALSQRSRRHAALSANIANADTPGYRAVDVGFGRELQRAGLALEVTHPAHSGGHGARSADRLVLSGGVPRADGNDVDIDREMVKLARNQIEYQFLARRLSGHFRKLKEAITGRAT